MASHDGSNILYLIGDELLFPHGEHSDGLASQPQTLRGLSAFEENHQALRGAGSYARTLSRRSFKGYC